ncbi:MAG: DUF4426 domain-containing protein [Panacagrimonas sp.]
MSRAIIAIALLLTTLTARAEQYVEQDGFRVHYAALPTTDLQPEVAKRFGVSRSSRRILLVLNAQRVLADGQTQSVAATGNGNASSLLGHVQKLRLRSEREADVHYLLAQLQALDGEYLNFDLSVTPEGTQRPIGIRFQQQFYLD